MTSPPRSARRADAVRNRALILQAARDVFAERGVEAPSSEIAAAAGVGQGTLYRHFPDRVTLLLTMLDENIAWVESGMAEAPAGGRDVAALMEMFLELQVHSHAAISWLMGPGPDDAQDSLTARTRALFARALDEPTSSPMPGTSADDLVVVLAMVGGAVGLGQDADGRREMGRTALRLLAPTISQPAAPDPADPDPADRDDPPTPSVP